MRVVAIILLWLALATASRAAEPVASLPYRIDYDGWITVGVTVNGKGPYDFVIDTGSTLTIAFANLALQQNFPPSGGPALRILGISTADELTPYVLGEIGLGEAVLKDHVGAVLPDWAPPRRTPHGIIGLDFLSAYAVYFDHQTRTMTLYPHGGIPEPLTKGLARIKLKPNAFGTASGVLFTVDGHLNREKITFIIDLGSVSSLINYKAGEAIYANSLAIAHGPGRGSTTGSRIADVFDDRTRARTALIYRIEIGGVWWRGLSLWLYNAPIFDELGVQRLPYGLAGLDLLADRDFALDFGENKMFIAKRPRRTRD